MATPTAEAAANAAKVAFSSASLTSAPFVARESFDVSSQIVRSYFLGHHNAAISRMRRSLSNIGLVIECRDLRVPLTSWNPLLESTLMYNTDYKHGSGNADRTFGTGSTGGRARIIVYTKRDLVSPADARSLTSKLAKFHSKDPNTTVLFHGAGSETKDTRTLLHHVKEISLAQHNLTGLRALVVGMPNAGKSTLLNRLRGQSRPNAGGASRVARTGAEPGVTRKLGTPVRILAEDGDSAGAFMVDTPGVFIPFVDQAEAMLKLVLVGCVKDGLINWLTVADYLLYHLNLQDPTGKLYAEYCDTPTNDVEMFLRGVARRTGKLTKGSGEALEGAADWVVRRWRNGLLGKFVLDQVTEQTLESARKRSLEPPLSMNQARKRDKEVRKEKRAAKWAARGE